MKYVLTFAVFLSVFFVGCSRTPESANSFTPSEDAFSASSADGSANTLDSRFSSLQEDEFQDRVEGYASYKELLAQQLPSAEIGLPDIVNQETLAGGNFYIESVKTANLTANGSAECVLIRCESERQASVWILAVDAGDSVVFRYIGMCDSDVPLLYFADIDGDHLDEILAHCGTMGTGQTGPYLESAVYKLTDNVFEVLYYSTYHADSVNLVDMGFEFAFYNGYQGVMVNRHTDMKTVFDASEFLFFDADGNVEDPAGYIRANEFYDNKGAANNFSTFKPADIDEDEMNEILVTQSFGIEHQFMIYVGTCYAALKYDSDTGQFHVAKSDFSPTGKQPTLPDYENSWYKR